MCRQCPGGPGYVVNGIRSFVTLQFSTTTWRAILDCGLALLFALRSRMLTMKLKDRKKQWHRKITCKNQTITITWWKASQYVCLCFVLVSCQVARFCQMFLRQALLGTNVRWSFEIDEKFLQMILIFALLYFTTQKKCSSTFRIYETFLQLLFFTLLFWWQTGRHVEVGHHLPGFASLFW